MLGVTTATGIAQQSYTRELSSILTPGRLIYDPDYALAQDETAYETILRDPDSRHAIEFRKHLVSGRAWRMVPATDSPADRKAAALMEELFAKIEGFEESRLNLANAIFLGRAYAFTEGRRETKSLLGGPEIAWWTPKRLVDVSKRRFRLKVNDQGVPVWQFYSVVKGREGDGWEDLGERARWFTRVAYADSEETLGNGRGLLEAIYFAQYAKTKCLTEGLEGLEKWAQGVIVAEIDGFRKGSAGKNNAAFARSVIDEIKKQRGGHVLAHEKGDKISVLGGPSGAKEMVGWFVDYFDTAIRTLCLGANLPTSATSGGSYALGEVQENSTEAFVSHDRAIQGSGITRGALALVWHLNAPQRAVIGLGKANMPSLVITQQKREDPEKAVTVVTALLDRGVDLREDEVYQKTGFTAPTPADRVVKGRSSPTPSPFGLGLPGVPGTPPSPGAPGSPGSPGAAFAAAAGVAPSVYVLQGERETAAPLDLQPIADAIRSSSASSGKGLEALARAIVQQRPPTVTVAPAAPAAVTVTVPRGPAPVTHVAAPNVSVSPVVNVVASSAPKKVSLHLDGDDVTGVIVPGQGS